MFTGIIESQATLVQVTDQGSNKRFTFTCQLTSQLKIDQSIAHNGVCLTVVDINGSLYSIDAVEETLVRSNINMLQIGDAVNIERCMLVNSRLDGHIVQGHVDDTGEIIGIEDKNGSWIFRVQFNATYSKLIVEKGSICINGVSLTVVKVDGNQFMVAIIPYTFENTNFKTFKVGTKVNLEFDILGKYIANYMQNR